MATTRKTNLRDYTMDTRNINKGSEEGMDLLNRSLDEVGYGRSVLVDKNNVFIAGNKTAEAALAKGDVKTIEVETTGDELVVVKRKDLDITTQKGIKAKILDNTVSKKNYVEDAEVSDAICEEYHLDAETYGLTEEEEQKAKRENYKVKGDYKIEVVCKTLKEQNSLFKKLVAQGHIVRRITK